MTALPPKAVSFDAASGPDVICYTVRNGFAWAYISVRSGVGQTGTGDPRGWVNVAALSDYGTFGYCWSHIGSEPWWKFLADLDFEYAMRKMLGARYDAPLDLEAACDKVKAMVLEHRREGSWSREDARALWDALPYCNETTFLADLDHHSDGAMSRHELWYCRWTQPSPQARGFWDDIWPHFIAGITPAAEVAV